MDAADAQSHCPSGPSAHIKWNGEGTADRRPRVEGSEEYTRFTTTFNLVLTFAPRMRSLGKAVIA